MLSILLLIPLLGAALLGFLPFGITAKLSRKVALVVASIAFLWTIVIASQFNPGEMNKQFTEFLPWIDALGLNYYLGIDGLSLPLLLLNGLLTWIAIDSTDENISRPRFYYSLLLLLNAGVTGAFMAQDLLLFFLFYEIELIPLYFLIAIWGGERRGYAATKFLIYTAVSGIMILASFLGMVWLSGASSFALDALNTSVLSVETQVLLLLGILIGFGIKIPLVPLHTWLPDAHVEASTPISVLLAGVLLKLGTYGLLRFGMNLLPNGWSYVSPVLATWAVISVLYGASCAIAQNDMKKMVAYSSIGHMGFVLLAAAAATPLSVLGCIMQMISHGLISALLFLLVGIVYKKTGSRDLGVLQGLLNPERGMPVIGSLMVLGVMASAGIPGMVGFISEFIIFRGSFAVFPVQTLLAMIGTGLTAVYFLILMNRGFFGRLSAQVVNLPRVSWGDRIPAVVLAVLIVIFGVQPNWLVRWTEPTMTTMVNIPTPVATVSFVKEKTKT
ncbi:MAG: NADH-quinone oxidoreductase subunit M [Brasilonema octagenarum HA4186-MV1]|jgi:NAD(P)H-quinone oxidoreductase subunit 4|uniref:NADH-quinone oxidoreductase subunit M n=2 Tax=Brasilonema TaxID=383614 RepID=A0A856MHK0_9CYAN|nr:MULTISPECIES: NADH-quinone oxidoreductase subunit M [Brasilonema]MBW4625376.1 NADH-quinone oxidoreductase subunit M [Brasilonema octagenarum HA4186-MV1]NMF66704.1 NADH-quinone oxidoreductase subunit M [Brasilonema octagenarum UFV-OR1]QDL08446.1 NADH-quinone oxidoreductase subunit M [Brasilonema sennae CENA114]QDL14802.1 NADH-quinone oxidoreductase subunit M [Brasilonema octagenarum UFV-E1]